jgi:hypothetical protein
MKFLVFLLTLLASVSSFVVVTQQSAVPTSSLHMTTLTFRGKKKDFPPGSPLSKACANLGVPVKYSCKK